MPCNTVDEHLLCSQQAAADVCSHTYIAPGCSVSGLENSLKRTLQSTQAWTPPPSLAVSPSFILGDASLQGTGILLRLIYFKAVMTGAGEVSVQLGFLLNFLLRRPKVVCWLEIQLCFVLFLLYRESLCTLTSCWDTFVFSNCLRWSFSCSGNDILLFTP